MSADPNDISGSDTDFAPNAMNKFFKSIEGSTPEVKKQAKMMPNFSDDDSSDSYGSFSRKKGRKHLKSSQSKKSETDDNPAFTTSQNSVDYTKLDPKIVDLQSDEDESDKVYRPPAPSSVAFHLNSSSDDEDFKVKSKPKMASRRKPAESVAPKRIKFDQGDDSISQLNGRPLARSTAPSTVSTKSSKSSKSQKRFSEFIKENRLDRELAQLLETESRLTAAEQEKLMQDVDFYTGDNFSKSGDSKSHKSRKQDQQQDQGSDDETFSQNIQTIAEEHYAKMLRKKFPQLVKKKAVQQKMQNDQYKLNFNNNIINWSREMIANENANIQNEINEINKELKRLRKENAELKKKIKLCYQDQ